MPESQLNSQEENKSELTLSLSKNVMVSVFLLRLGMGWLFFYAGITKILAPGWSAAGYLRGAKTFTAFYEWLASPAILPIINFINEWGLLFLGLSLILGLFARLSSVLGALLMVLYYFPILQFPYPNPHSFIVDEHIVYALALVVLAAIGSGRFWGLQKWCSGLPICSKYPKLRHWIG